MKIHVSTIIILGILNLLLAVANVHLGHPFLACFNAWISGWSFAFVFVIFFIK